MLLPHILISFETFELVHLASFMRVPRLALVRRMEFTNCPVLVVDPSGNLLVHRGVRNKLILESWQGKKIIEVPIDYEPMPRPFSYVTWRGDARRVLFGTGTDLFEYTWPAGKKTQVLGGAALAYYVGEHIQTIPVSADGSIPWKRDCIIPLGASGDELRLREFQDHLRWTGEFRTFGGPWLPILTAYFNDGAQFIPCRVNSTTWALMSYIHGTGTYETKLIRRTGRNVKVQTLRTVERTRFTYEPPFQTVRYFVVGYDELTPIIDASDLRVMKSRLDIVQVATDASGRVRGVLVRDSKPNAFRLYRPAGRR